MPQIFVTGVERSGATLAANILHDVYDVPMANIAAKWRSPRPGWTHMTFEDAKLHDILTGSFETETDLKDAFEAYVKDRREYSGPVWGAKSVNFAPRLAQLVSACDNPIVIDVWRSPASVMASWLASADQPYQAAQATYLRQRSANDVLLSRLGCPVVSVDFDALVSDPTILSPVLEQVGVMAKRLDLAYSVVREDMIHYDSIGRWIKRSVNRKLGRWGKVAIGIRSANGPEPETFTCFLKMLSVLRPGDGLIEPATNLPAHWAADDLACKFLNSDADSLLMIDDDMTFRSSDLATLRDHVEGQQYDILSAFATRRQYPPRPVTMRRLEYQPPNPMAQGGVHYAHVLEHKEGYRVFEADMTGLAFTLIRRHVFESMIGEWGPAWTQFFPFVRHQSDDAEFCIRAKELGMRIGVCLDVSIGHIGKEVYGKSQLGRWLTEVADALDAAMGGTHAPATS